MRSYAPTFRSLVTRPVDTHSATKDVAVLIEAGVVRVNEKAWPPLVALPTHLELVQSLLAPFRVFTQMGDDRIVLIQERDPAVQVGNQHDIPLDVDIGGKKKAPDGLEVLASHIEPLQALIGTVGDD